MLGVLSWFRNWMFRRKNLLSARTCQQTAYLTYACLPREVENLRNSCWIKLITNKLITLYMSMIFWWLFWDMLHTTLEFIRPIMDWAVGRQDWPNLSLFHLSIRYLGNIVHRLSAMLCPKTVVLKLYSILTSCNMKIGWNEWVRSEK